MKLQKDLREFVGLLVSHGVDFVVVGGHAVAFHGYPRFTGDIDLLLRPVLDNANKVIDALGAFGFSSLALDLSDLSEPGRVVQLGLPPNRIDLLTSLTGVRFEQVWQNSLCDTLDGLPVRFISRSDLLANKRAVGRAKDLADVEALQGGLNETQD